MMIYVRQGANDVYCLPDSDAERLSCVRYCVVAGFSGFLIIWSLCFTLAVLQAIDMDVGHVILALALWLAGALVVLWLAVPLIGPTRPESVILSGDKLIYDPGSTPRIVQRLGLFILVVRSPTLPPFFKTLKSKYRNPVTVPRKRVSVSIFRSARSHLLLHFDGTSIEIGRCLLQAERQELQRRICRWAAGE